MDPANQIIRIDRAHELAIQHPLDHGILHPINDSFELRCLSLFNLLRQGKLNEFRQMIDHLSPQVLIPCLNYHLEDEYGGTVLHCLLYWNDSPEAFQLYQYLRGIGALPTRDDYEQNPWEVSGQCYVFTQDIMYLRDPGDFINILMDVEDFEP